MSGSGAFRVFVALHMIDYASSHLLHFSKLAAAAGTNVGKINQQLKVMGGLASIMAGSAIIGFMTNLTDKSIDAANKLEQVERRVRALGGMSGPMFTSVSKTAWGLAGANPATTQVDRLEVFRDLHRVFADPNTSKKLLPGSLQFLTAMRALNPDVGQQEMYAAFKGAELTSLAPRKFHTINPDQFNHRLDVLTKIFGGMGVSPTDMFAFFKMARYNRGTLSDTGIYNSAAVIQELSGSTAGTTIQALSRAILAGRFGNSTTGLQYAKEAERLGLLTNITERARHGEPKRFDVKGASAFAQDPVEWLQQYMVPALARQHLDITKPGDQAGIIRQVARIFGSQVAAGGAYQIMSHYGVITKDRQQGEKAQGKGALAAMYQHSYSGAIGSVSSAMTDVLATLGKVLEPSIVPVLNTVTNCLRGLQTFAREHPTLTRLATVMGVLSGVFLIIAGAALTVVGILGVGGLLTALTGLASGPILGIAGTILAITAALLGLAGIAVALKPNISQRVQAFQHLGDNANTPAKMAARAAAWKESNAKAIQARHESMRAVHPGDKISSAININVHGVQDPVQVAMLVGKEVGKLMGTIQSDLVNPKSGNFHTFTPGMAHGYA
jgi:hypothetical protein